jgi:hypothetical protein
MTSTVKLDGVADKRGSWAKRIAEWQRSGQSQRVFCAQRGLALSTFQWWRRQEKQREAAQMPPAFLPIAMGVSAVEIELRSRTRMRFEGEAALRAVEHLVARVK